MSTKVDYSCKICSMLDLLYENAKDAKIQMNLQYEYHIHLEEEHTAVDLV